MKLSSNNTDTFINMNENLMNENDLLKFNSLHNFFTIYLNDFEKFNKMEILNYHNLIKNKNINAIIIFDTKNLNKDDSLLDIIDYNIELEPLEKEEMKYLAFLSIMLTFSLKRDLTQVPLLMTKY